MLTMLSFMLAVFINVDNVVMYVGSFFSFMLTMLSFMLAVFINVDNVVMYVGSFFHLC